MNIEHLCAQRHVKSVCSTSRIWQDRGTGAEHRAVQQSQHVKSNHSCSVSPQLLSAQRIALDLHLVLIGKLFRQIYILDLYKYVSIYSNALATNHKSYYIFLRKCKKAFILWHCCLPSMLCGWRHIKRSLN